ncbi:tyrosine-type recombinase/integrase [Methyloprofundus sp.]|uniref:tyrosine-type recombinase/integrase n=1 Tax=Methyloprofundus sp. TaxID=2020875 RepID=UPI003D0AE0C3
MARRITKKLAPKTIQSLRTKGLYGDGDGLWLKVTDSGSQSWIFRYTRDKKSRSIGLGSARLVPVTKAREEIFKYRQLLTEGKDPFTFKKALDEERRKLIDDVITFQFCATSYINSHKASWKNAKHTQQWTNTLATYAYPVIGGLLVKEIDTALIMRILEPIWLSKNETAGRLRGRIENIIAWAATQGYRSAENPARWKGHLENLLAKPSKVKKVKHHKALPYSEMYTFMQSLRNHDSVSANALEFLILTAARTNEVINATWDEIDLKNKVWIISTAKVKASREHRVPLSSRVIEIINEMAAVRVSDFIFTGRSRSGGLSNAAMDKLLQVTMKYDVTVQGFRSTFRGWAAERTNYPRDLCEMALAHAIKDKTEAAYRRGDMIEKRRKLMQDWLKYTELPSPNR